MLTPYAIVRLCDRPETFDDALGRPMRGVDACGLTLLVGDAIEARDHAEAFMDAVAAVHEQTTCVPVRFGEPLESETAGRRLIETGTVRFRRLLDQLEGADEWSIVVHPKADAGLVEAKPAGSADGGRSYLQRRRLDLQVAEGMRPEVSAVVAELSASFAPRVRDTRSLAGKAGGGSLAMLVDRDTDPAAMFRELAADVSLPCTLTGPWPAFSFVSLS